MPFADPVQAVQYLGFDGPMTLADFGAGTGAYSLLLARRLNLGKVYAIEIQPEVLGRLAAEAREQSLDNIEVIWGDVEKMGGSQLADGAVDGVLISNLLSQAKALYTLALEAARVLRPGGRVVIIDWQDSFGGLGPHPSEVVTALAAEQIFGGAGFRPTGEFSPGAHHWGRYFRKGA